jgi:hypothetical protein
VAGGLIGSLTRRRSAREHANYYAETVRRGRRHRHGEGRTRAVRIALRRSSARTVPSTSTSAYRGWREAGWEAGILRRHRTPPRKRNGNAGFMERTRSAERPAAHAGPRTRQSAEQHHPPLTA